MVGNKMAMNIAENDHYCGWWITIIVYGRYYSDRCWSILNYINIAEHLMDGNGGVGWLLHIITSDDWDHSLILYVDDPPWLMFWDHLDRTPPKKASDKLYSY